MIDHNRLKILELRVKLLEICVICAKRGLNLQKQLICDISQELTLVLKRDIKYDFDKRIATGSTLLVGEGNLSFTCALVRKVQHPNSIIASVYEEYSELSDEAKQNVQILKDIKLQILYGLDGKKLHKTFSTLSLDTIIFQFPHTGSRESINGENPNYALARDFLCSAFCVLKKEGVVLITVVDSDYYDNMFKLEALAVLVGFKKPTKYNFNPLDYLGYEHTMTHQDESALKDYNKFTTYEFKPCSN